MAESPSGKKKSKVIIENDEIVGEPAGMLRDRMMRYRRYRRNPPCAVCGTHPVVVRMRREGYTAYRCRVCGAHWDITVEDM